MPDNDFLPARYHVEVYLGSFRDDPIYFAKSKSPFPVPSIGHHVNASLFEGHALGRGRLRVTDVEHNYWKTEDSHVSHKLMIAVAETAED